MQTKTKILLHTIRLSKIKKTDHIKCWRSWGANETFTHCWWEYQKKQQPWKTVWEFL